jgi:hypothetical protein
MPENRMRLRASHPKPHRSCVPGPPLSPRRRRHDCFSPTALASECRICRSSVDIQNRAILNANRCVASSPVCSKEQAGGGGRNARATSRAMRVSGRFPQRLTFANHRSAAGSAAIIWLSQELSRFAEPTVRQNVADRNTKKARGCAETVDEWTSLWKTLENSG